MRSRKLYLREKEKLEYRIEIMKNREEKLKKFSYGFFSDTLENVERRKNLTEKSERERLGLECAVKIYNRLLEEKKGDL